MSVALRLISASGYSGQRIQPAKQLKTSTLPVGATTGKTSSRLEGYFRLKGLLLADGAVNRGAFNFRHVEELLGMGMELPSATLKSLSRQGINLGNPPERIKARLAMIVLDVLLGQMGQGVDVFPVPTPFPSFVYFASHP